MWHCQDRKEGRENDIYITNGVFCPNKTKDWKRPMVVALLALRTAEHDPMARTTEWLSALTWSLCLCSEGLGRTVLLLKSVSQSAGSLSRCSDSEAPLPPLAGSYLLSWKDEFSINPSLRKTIIIYRTSTAEWKLKSVRCMQTWLQYLRVLCK